MIKKRVLIIIAIVFGVALLGTVGYLIWKDLNVSDARQTTKQIQQSYASDLPVGTVSNNNNNTNPGSSEQPKVSVPDAPGVPDVGDLNTENHDIYAWIYVPDTNISLPVAQSSDDDNFYLDHDVNKDYSFPGTIFSQAMNKKDFSDRVTVLYGHNMNDGSMFANLHYFGDRDFFDTHPYFYIFTDNRVLTYEVISAHEYDDRHIMNSYDFSKDDTFKEWLDSAQNPYSLYSNVREGLQLDLNSKIVVLSTCLNANEGRFLVQGVLIQDDKTG